MNNRLERMGICPKGTPRGYHSQTNGSAMKKRQVGASVAPSIFDDYALGFEDQVLRVEDPVVWIPRDEYGYSHG